MTQSSSIASLRDRAGAVVMVWVIRLVVAWSLALPLSQVVAHSGIAHQRGGDARLFEAGGLWLVELIRLEAGPLAAGANTLLWQFPLAAVLLLVPWTALLVSLSEPVRPNPARLAQVTAARFPRMLLLSTLTLLLQGGLLLLFVILIGVSRKSLVAVLDARERDLVALVLGGCGVLGALLLGVLQDLARGAIAGLAERVLPAIGLALRALRQRPLALFGDWLARVLLGAGLVLGVASLVQVIDVSQPTSSRVLVVAVLHASVVLALVVLRASWLAIALRATARTNSHEMRSGETSVPYSAPGDRAAHNAAPGGPNPGHDT